MPIAAAAEYVQNAVRPGAQGEPYPDLCQKNGIRHKNNKKKEGKGKGKGKRYGHWWPRKRKQYFRASKRAHRGETYNKKRGPPDRKRGGRGEGEPGGARGVLGPAAVPDFGPNEMVAKKKGGG